MKSLKTAAIIALSGLFVFSTSAMAAPHHEPQKQVHKRPPHPKKVKKAKPAKHMKKPPKHEKR
ncbi:hypothetical protein RYD26_08025 [Pasteurellaceae bacterium LIM206]|nr:hypothetical protein [Pasteurellaceae bacterium LIM206]